MSRQDSNNSRRNFIKKGAAGLAGITILPSVVKGAEGKSQEKAEQKKYKMIYRTLGKTGIKVPIISMGVMNADNPNLVRAALDAGIRHLDTAWIYQRGRNEEMVGQVIQGRPRDSYVIGTKIWEPRDRQTGMYSKNAKADTFIEKFETSLKRLGLEYVDILYHHNVYNKDALMFEPYIKAMQKFKKEGRVRFLGVSTHKNEPEIIRAAADSGVYEVVLTSYNYRQAHNEEIRKAVAYAAGKGLGIVGMKAIAVSREGGAPNPRAALKWALQDENFHTNIPGFTTFDQLYTDLSVMADLKLTPQEKADLVEASKVAGLYCQQCGKCLGQCPKGVYIPDLMRSYMYAYGYRNLMAAKEALDGMDLNNLACKDCSTCRVKCSVGFDVKEKALAIARIKDVPEDFLV